MASMPWIKVHTDFLDDPKLSRASDINKLRFLQLCILAGICDNDGALVDGETILDDEYIASRLRVRPTLMSSSLRVLNELKLIDRIDGVWFVTNFSKRQGRPQSEKRAKWREWQARRRDKKGGVMHDSGMTQAGVIGIEGEKEKEKETEVIRDSRPPNNAPVIVTPQAASHVSMTPPPSNPEPAAGKRSKLERKQTENYRPIFGWLQELCQINAPARVGRVAKSIDDSGAVLGACDHFSRWWKTCDWRGMKGQAPTPEQVWQEWPKALAWDGSAPARNGNGRHADEPAGFEAIRQAMQDPRYKAEEAKLNGKLS